MRWDSNFTSALQTQKKLWLWMDDKIPLFWVQTTALSLRLSSSSFLVCRSVDLSFGPFACRCSFSLISPHTKVVRHKYTKINISDQVATASPTFAKRKRQKRFFVSSFVGRQEKRLNRSRNCCSDQRSIHPPNTNSKYKRNLYHENEQTTRPTNRAIFVITQCNGSAAAACARGGGVIAEKNNSLSCTLDVSTKLKRKKKQKHEHNSRGSDSSNSNAAQQQISTFSCQQLLYNSRFCIILSSAYVCVCTAFPAINLQTKKALPTIQPAARHTRIMERKYERFG